MSRRYFGTDGIRGLANTLADDVGGGAEGRHGRRQDLPDRQPPPPRRDRQGHAPVRLHAGSRADVGLHRRRHGRVPARPDADARRRHADALAARRSRRDDLGLAQPLRRQRHQAVRSRRLQALRRDRAADRGADRRRHRRAAGPRRGDRPRHAGRKRAGALHRVRQAHAAARTCASTGCASSSIAPTAPATRWRPRRCGSSAPRSSRSASSPTAATSTTSAARPRPTR